MPIILKTLFLALARKYAGDLLIKLLIDVLEKMAPKSDNTIDDALVSILKAEQKNIADTIRAGLGG